MNTDYIELLRKVKTLADRGVNGEKENATRLLEKLMEKHGVTIDQIIVPEREYVKFSPRGQKKLFFQVVFSVVDGWPGSYTPDKSAIWIQVTAAERIQIEYKFDLMLKAFKKEQALFLKAFIQKNNLYSANAKTRSYDELTKEELEEAMRVRDIARNIERVNVYKQIGD